jgi:hypothetical protein
MAALIHRLPSIRIPVLYVILSRVLKRGDLSAPPIEIEASVAYHSAD